MADHKLNRREFLRTAGAGALGVGALFEGALSAEGRQGEPRIGDQVPRIQQPILGPGKSVLTIADFTYLGLFTVPDDPRDQNGRPTRFGFSYGTIAGRYVGDQLRFAITGAYAPGDNWWQPVYEISYPGVGPDIAHAPRASLVQSWGDITQGRRRFSRGTNGEIRGLLWHGGYLWWAYGDPYNAGSTGWDPSIGCSSLERGGAVRAYGPWRTTQHSQRTRGYLLTVPASFASQYTHGRTLAVGAPITSGNQESPWGPALFALAAIDPTTTPADPVQTAPTYTGHERKSLACQTLVLNDRQHPAARNTEYSHCGWDVFYDCSRGSWLHPGAPTWQSIDQIDGGVWIDGPTKHGVVFFGNQIDPRPGADPATWPHYWYGPRTCCHGRVARKAWEATGPGTDSLMPYWYIYDPQQLAGVADGTVRPWALRPAQAQNRYALYGQDVWMHFHGGAWFDATSHLLFVSTRMEDHLTNHYEPRPVIRVFKVNA